MQDHAEINAEMIAEIKKVLAVVAHPDDIDFGAAGTIAKLTDAGAEVVYCLVTDGDAGGFDREVDNGGMAALRRAEQTAAAKCVGVEDLRFLGYPDGAVEQTLGLRRDISRVIRQVRPDLVLTSSPERNYALMGASHPDHRAVGGATLDAVYPDARNPYAFPELLADEGLEAWAVSRVWLMGTPAPDHYMNVTETVHRKITALRAHESQTAHMDGLEEMIKGWLARLAAAVGLPDGSFAEAFQALNTA
jgi:LmbE family N-acetylglucosaminyl deacetylase